MAIDRPKDAEPPGDTIDGVPWEEPRGPHLPDLISSQPVLVWPFLALAALIVASDLFETIRLSPLSPADILRVVLRVIPSVATALLGAAWLRRHPRPDLRSPMAAAVTLLAVAAAMRLAAPWVVDTASSLVPDAGDDVFGSLRWSGAWSAVEGAVLILGYVAFVMAFRDARRRPFDPRERPATIAVAAIAILTMGLEVGSLWPVVSSTTEAVPGALSGLLLSLLFDVVTAALAVQLVRGALAGEQPAIAWRLGAIGFVVDLGATTFATLASVVGPLTQAWFEPYVWILVIVDAIGALALLAAITLGLPADTPALAGAAADRG